MPNLGFDIGNALTGGDIDREGARLEGLNTGSQIQARKASTVNALAQARLRTDEAEAKIGLADALEDAFGDQGRSMATHLRAGGKLEDFTGAQGDIQEQGFRDTLADVNAPTNVRQGAGLGIRGAPVTAKDMLGASGSLAFDVFNPDNGLSVTPVGEANIAADEASANQRNSTAALREEQRLHPERFKSSSTINLGADITEQLLPGGVGTSIVPDDLNASAAFGAEAFLKGGANAVGDFLGLGTIAPSEAQANAVFGELSARTQIVMRADVPGGRPPVIVQELLGRYAEDPRQLFRGDDLAKQNLTTTVASLKRTFARVKTLLDLPTKKTATRQGELEDQFIAYGDLIADYEKVLQSLENTGGAGEQVDIGAQIPVPGGTATRIE